MCIRDSIILGPLAGLVAITAGCNSMSSVISIFVGIIGSIIAIIVNETLNKFEIDDVVGAVPVHLAAGIWGTLAVGLFSDLTILDTGLDRFSQIKIQLIGITSIGLFTFVSSYFVLSLVNKFYPLRVSPVQEELGLNIAEHNAVSVEHDLISILDKQSESGDLKIRGPQDPFTAGGVIGLYYNKLMSKLETSEEEKNKWRARISKEVKLAVKVQENFLPKRNLENYPVKGINIAAREVSGDFFSFYPHNDNVYFIIADVAGKGIHAGMVMAKASTLFEIMARDKVDVDEIAFHMNNDLFYTKTSGMFVTSIIGNYNITTGEIVWVNAGHQPALVRDKNGNFEEYESKSPPLGVIVQKAKSSYSIDRINLNSNRLYAFTDGLSESENENGQEISINFNTQVLSETINFTALPIPVFTTGINYTINSSTTTTVPNSVVTYDFSNIVDKLKQGAEISLDLSLGTKNFTAYTMDFSKEYIEIKQILGLETDKQYDSIEDIKKGLRYGKILFMTDQDLDGSHICLLYTSDAADE